MSDSVRAGVARASLTAHIIDGMGGPQPLPRFAPKVPAGWIVQLLVFAGGSIASLAILRPIARRHLRLPGMLRTGTAALVGGDALVVERVDATGGRVKIGGEVWSARAFDGAQVLEPGSRVQVAEIEGATALVYE